MKKNTLITIGLVSLMLLLLCFPNICLKAGQDGLLLWFNKVLPSLLPFIILVNILIPLNGFQPFIQKCTPFINRLWHLPGESFFAFFIGLLAGYPMGAKMVKNLFDQGLLSQDEATHTLCFCNNCGPLFIIGTVGTAMLSQTHLGYFLYLIHFLSALTLSLLLTSHRPQLPIRKQTIPLSLEPVNFFKLLNHSVMNAMDTIVCVGGYIILFSVLLALLTQTPFVYQLLGHTIGNHSAYLTFTGILSGLFELSNGTYTLSKLPLSPLMLALITSSIGFGGICVYFQSLYVLDDSPISTKPLFFSKCLQGLLSFSYTLILYPLYNLLTPQPNPLNSSLYTRSTSFSICRGDLLLGISLFVVCLIASLPICHHLSLKD